MTTDWMSSGVARVDVPKIFLFRFWVEWKNVLILRWSVFFISSFLSVCHLSLAFRTVKILRNYLLQYFFFLVGIEPSWISRVKSKLSVVSGKKLKLKESGNFYTKQIFWQKLLNKIKAFLPPKKITTQERYKTKITSLSNQYLINKIKIFCICVSQN